MNNIDNTNNLDNINNMYNLNNINNMNNMNNLENINIKLIQKNSEYFPKKLYDLPDCPDVLFVLGNEKILNSFSISIIGTRNSSEQGNSIAYNLSKDLSSNNFTIVSGLASGIDSQAHLGTLSNSFSTSKNKASNGR